MKFLHEIEDGHPLPSTGYGVLVRSVDFSLVAHGSSIAVPDANKAMSIRSSLNHYQKQNPDKLVGFRCMRRKDKKSGTYRIFFIDPAVL